MRLLSGRRTLWSLEKDVEDIPDYAEATKAGEEGEVFVESEDGEQARLPADEDEFEKQAAGRERDDGEGQGTGRYGFEPRIEFDGCAEGCVRR